MERKDPLLTLKVNSICSSRKEEEEDNFCVTKNYEKKRIAGSGNYESC